MGSLDSNGIYVYDGTDNVSPLQVTLNLLASSVSSKVADLIDELTVPDTGWVDVTIASGFAVQGTVKPQVRRIGNVVHSRGGWNPTGISAGGSYTVGNIPEGFRPGIEGSAGYGNACYFNFVGSNGTSASSGIGGRGSVASGGSITLQASPTPQSYYLFPMVTWTTDNAWPS